MTDNDKSKSKSQPHEFRQTLHSCGRAWVPEAEAQKVIAELERLDAYMEEIERLREGRAPAEGARQILRDALTEKIQRGVAEERNRRVRYAVGVDVEREVSSVVTLRYSPDNGGTWEIVDVRSTGPGGAL